MIDLIDLYSRGEGDNLYFIYHPSLPLFPLRDLAKGQPSGERERHPVFPDLHKAERDFILSPQGERNIVEAYFLGVARMYEAGL